MSKPDRIKQMHELIDQVSHPRHAVHESYKAKMKEILWIYTNHLTEVMYKLPEDCPNAPQIVQAFIDEFVDNSFVVGK
jgi:hypothetical protein